MTAIPNVTEAARVRHRRLAKELARRCARVLGHDRHFFLEAQPNVRFTVPYPSAVENPALDEFAWNGKVTAHGPHHDSWYCCPTNCINLWIAVSDVVVGNGLTIYPRLHGKRLPCDARGHVLRGQYFQGALNFELRARDALVFHGDHLHTSELNWTDMTRARREPAPDARSTRVRRAFGSALRVRARSGPTLTLGRGWSRRAASRSGVRRLASTAPGDILAGIPVVARATSSPPPIAPCSTTCRATFRPSSTRQRKWRPMSTSRSWVLARSVPSPRDAASLGSMMAAS